MEPGRIARRRAPGFMVGHAVHANGCTGCTVVLCPPRPYVGAGNGATVGKLLGLANACKGGLGGTSLVLGDLVVGALAVVTTNACLNKNGAC